MKVEKKLYGVCHDRETGDAMVRVPRVLKVSIGLPKGPAKHVYIDQSNQWVVQTGSMVKEDGGDKPKYKTELKRFTDMEEARKYYLKAEVSERPYPVRLPYFTFTKVGHDGTQWPDWDAIKHHGSLPTSIQIVMVEDEPLTAEYQLWANTELRCHGDGRDAKRLVSFQPDAKEAIKAAKENKRRFDIIGGCATRGCQLYSVNIPMGQAKPKGCDCKPHGELRFQLIGNVMLGGTAYYVTTGKRSISNLFSSLQTFKAVTGGPVAGIPMLLVMAPYRAMTPMGKAQTQYAVHLQFRVEQAAELRRKLSAATNEFYSAGITPSVPQLSPGEPVNVTPTIPPEGESVTEPGVDDEFAAEASEAAAYNAEFTGGADEETPAASTEDGASEEEAPAIETLIDPTIAGQIQGAGAAMKPKAMNRKEINRHFQYLVRSYGSTEAAIQPMMRTVGLDIEEDPLPGDEPKKRDGQFSLPDLD